MTPSKQEQPLRLYKRVVRQLIDDLNAGKYAVGDRLPAERELALTQGVSRPAIREAILALEVDGLIEVRIGSGAYVVKLPGKDSEDPGFAISAFEAMEARLLLEGEAAALATTQITDDELDELDALVVVIAESSADGAIAEEAEASFSRTVAKATRNAAIELMHAQLWMLRSASPDCALMLEKARTANVRPVVDEYRAIVAALRSRNAGAARGAMRAHITAVIDHLLFAIEEEAVAAARLSVQSTRQRYNRSVSV